MSLLARVRWINLALVALAALALGLTWWTRRLPTSGELEVRQSHLLPVFREEQLDEIELQRGHRRTVLVRAAKDPRQRGPEIADLPRSEQPGDADAQGEWRLTEPFETDADTLAVEKLVGSLRYATWEREAGALMPAAAPDGTPAALRAEHVITLGMGDISYRLRLGPQSPSPPGSHYVEVTRGESPPRVYVIKKSLVEELFVDGSVFRGRQIVPYGKSSVRQMILSSAAGVRRLTRSGADFRFDGMHDAQRAERGALDRIFLALARATADPFLDLEAAKAALSVDVSAVRVALAPLAAEKPEASLEFGGVCPSDPEKAVAIRHLPEPLAGCVETSVLLPLREPADVLIDRGLFAFNADEVDSVRIVSGERVLDFARSGDSFTLREPRAAAIDAAAASDRLSRILAIRGELLEPRDKPAAPLSATEVTLESHSRFGAEPTRETVHVGPARANGARLVSRNADGAVLLITAEEALALAADATLLKSTQVFDYALRDLRAIEVNYGSLKQVLTRSEEGALALTLPKGYDVDGALATALMDELRALKALRWVNDSASKGFGLDKPRATVRLRLVVGGEPLERVLTLGRSAPGGHYASVDRDPGVFVLPRSIERTLGTWLLDRSVFHADRESISEISLEAPGRGAVKLKRVAGELTIIKASAGFDSTRIDELLDAIEALRPDAAVHPGRATSGEGLRRPILTGVVRRISPKAVGLPPIRLSVGSRDSFKDASIYYARHASVNATYALPRNQVQALLDLF